MAKRGILEHPKTIELAALLDLPECYAVGILECLWHHVARYFPCGEITGLKPSILARSIRYPGEPQALWEALQATGFLETLDGRTFVHDWSEHADNSVHQLLKKRGELFADGHEPFTRAQVRNAGRSQTVCERFTNGSRLPEPKPKPEPEPEPEPTRRAQGCARAQRRTRAREDPPNGADVPSALSPGGEPPGDPFQDEPEREPEPTGKREPWEDDWLRFLALYPKRSGDRGVKAGRAAYGRLVQAGKVAAETLLQGCRAYRAWVDATGKASTELVKQIPSWLHGECWQEAWEVPARPAPLSRGEQFSAGLDAGHAALMTAWDEKHGPPRDA